MELKWKWDKRNDLCKVKINITYNKKRMEHGQTSPVEGWSTFQAHTLLHVPVHKPNCNCQFFSVTYQLQEVSLNWRLANTVTILELPLIAESLLSASRTQWLLISVEVFTLQIALLLRPNVWGATRGREGTEVLEQSGTNLYQTSLLLGFHNSYLK